MYLLFKSIPLMIIIIIMFVDDLKVYQESHKALKIVNEIIVQASHDTGACYGVSKCAEIIYQNGKMVRGEGLQVLEERMKTMNPDENEIYKFLGIEQADGIKTKAVYERVKEEVTKRVKMLTKTELNDANLIKAINMKVIPVATYAMNVCKFTVAELNYREQEEECHSWLRQNLHGRKTSSIMTMLEEMVETRSWKVSRGLAQDKQCRVCHERDETVELIVAGCKVLANSEYLTRHNRALMIMAVNWAKEYELIGNDVIWYKERWERGAVLENERGKLVWNFEFKLRKTTTARRPDLILEDKEKKKIWICDMACPQQQNVATKRLRKLTKYRQLAFETRERRAGYNVMVVPLIIGALGGGMRQITKNLGMIFENNDIKQKTICEMQKTVVMDSETMVRKVLSGLIQDMDE